MECNGILPFLDVKVHRTDNTGIFNFSIYRKPTNVCSYIHYYSNHPVNVKESVFVSMFLRAFRICSPGYFDDEISNIYKIGQNLKYPLYLLDKSLNKARKSFYSINNRTTVNFENLLVLPFYPNIIEIQRLLRIFKVNVVFNNNCTLKNILIKNSPACKTGSVYKIPCKHCQEIYIGQTSKELDVRLKQHKYCVRTGNMANALFVHMNNTNHGIDWENSKELVICKDFMKRNIIESSFIKNEPDRNFNISLGMYRLDPLIINNVCKMFKI